MSPEHKSGAISPLKGTDNGTDSLCMNLYSQTLCYFFKPSRQLPGYLHSLRLVKKAQSAAIHKMLGAFIKKYLKYLVFL